MKNGERLKAARRSVLAQRPQVRRLSGVTWRLRRIPGREKMSATPTIEASVVSIVVRSTIGTKLADPLVISM